MKHVIIGNGIAGVSAAEAIRELDKTSAITMIGDETFPPYSRPMIGYVLEGSQPHKKLPIRSSDIYEELKIEPLLGQRATALDVENCQVILADNSKIHYDRLLIAAGADPRPVRAAGLELQNIFYMRTQAHATAQVEALPGAQKAVVLGGGLVGFKAAYGLLRRGLQVTMLITSGYPLSMQVDPIAGRMIMAEMVRHGLTVEVGVSATAFVGDTTVEAVETDDGRTLPCDLVIIGKGVLPCRDFLPRERIKVDLGVLVNEHLQTSIKGIYAAGDVAELYDLARDCRWVNALWPEAVGQGRVAGYNMAGRKVVYPGSLSRNVMRVFELDVLTVGDVNPGDPAGYETVSCGGEDQGFYRRLVCKGNRLVGAVLINDIAQGGVLRALIENRVSLRRPAARLLQRNFNFGQLL
jgi:NAD(P)H-nitrite reductase large subunit